MSLAELLLQLSVLIGLPAVLLAGAGAAVIVIARDWRAAIFGYLLVSLMLALLLSQILPAEWGLMQAIAGGLVCVMLFLSARQLSWLAKDRHDEARWPRMASLSTFRALAVGLAAVAYFALYQEIEFPNLAPLFRNALVWLALMGILGLALHEEPLHAGLSLLTFLGGSELLLFSLLQRRMLVGMVLALQVLLGLAVAYLVLARGLEARAAAVDGAGGDT